jgi:hypothetical protein
MGKRTRILLWLTAVIFISGINLSSMCRHDVPLNLDMSIKTQMSDAAIGVELPETEVEPTADISDLLDDAAVQELTWRMLTDVEFKDVYIEELDAYYWKPTFGDTVKALEGKEVFITGYVIPVDYDADFYVLSRYPFANCYFCGGAGPESVIDLRFPGKTRAYRTDERLTFKGELALNADDVYQMNYILDGAIEHN